MLKIPGTQPNTLVEFRRGPDKTIQTREIPAEPADSLAPWRNFESVGNDFLPQLRRCRGVLVGRFTSPGFHPDASKAPPSTDQFYTPERSILNI